jgi:decaprenylphospho-beta-D-ribofuranose 2-oxidase
VARGRGTAYGDAAINEGGSIVSTARLSRLLAFDANTGLLTCEAGVSIRTVIEFALPMGFFPAVTPGTWKATVGGCLACDVHGKNHHIEGSFAQHVTAFRLMVADGSVVVCTPEQEPELFWATAGGLGLTGLILDVTLRLRRVETSAVLVRYLKLPDLDATFAALEARAAEPYSVCWLDVLTRGRGLGRSVLMLGDHAKVNDLPSGLRERPLALPPTWSLQLPFAPPPFLLSSSTLRLFNAAYFRHFPDHGEPVVQGLRPFFYPLEAIDNFNQLYGKRGFLEYQLVLPARTAPEVFRKLLETLSRHGYGSFLAVVKRLGPANLGPLSFPAAGYTVAVDIPMRDDRLLTLLHDFDERVTSGGGRVYLAKDSRLNRQVIDAMYPRRRAWAALLDRLDPGQSFGSGLSRRLALRSV